MIVFLGSMLITSLMVMLAYWIGSLRQKDKHNRPWEYDWVKPTPYQELEEWWNANQSKDARIQELERLLNAKSSLISKQQSKLRELQGPGPSMSLSNTFLDEARKRAGLAHREAYRNRETYVKGGYIKDPEEYFQW